MLSCKMCDVYTCPQTPSGDHCDDLKTNATHQRALQTDCKHRARNKTPPHFGHAHPGSAVSGLQDMCFCLL